MKICGPIRHLSKPGSSNRIVEFFKSIPKFDICRMEFTDYYQRFGLELFEGTLHAHAYPWHYHDCYTLVCVETGSMKYAYQDKVILVKAGQVHLVNPYVSHSNVPVTECKYFCFFLPLNRDRNSSSLVHFEETVVTEKLLFGQLKKLFARAKKATGLKTVEKILDELYRLMTEKFPSDSQTPFADLRINKAIEYINDNLDKKLSVKELAELSFLSPYHFQRVFKKAIGLTVNDFIQQQRTSRGKSLIRKGNPLTEVALDVGYFDQSHFNKGFKKMWVSKPSDFKSKK